MPNVPPEVISQLELSVPAGQSLQLRVGHFEIEDPDSSVFTLHPQAGDNYSLSGQLLTPAPGFVGTLTVPLMVSDGRANSPIFPALVRVAAGGTPQLQLSASRLAIAEDGGESVLTASLSQALGEALTLFLDPGGDATAGSDYELPLSITIAAGQTSASVILRGLDDSEIEGDEVVAVRPQLGSSGVTLASPRLDILLRDDDQVLVGDDRDGIPSEEEDRVGDGNGDGLPDSSQRNVASTMLMTHSLGDGSPNMVSITVALLGGDGSGAELGNVSVRPLADALPLDQTAPAEVNALPLEWISFDIDGLASGECVQLNLLFGASGNGVLPDYDGYVKFGRTASNPQPHLYEFAFDGQTGAQVQRVSRTINGSPREVLDVTLHLCDGQRGDDDLSANGRIADPGMPGQVAGVISGSSSGGSGQLGLGVLGLALLAALRRRAPRRLGLFGAALMLAPLGLQAGPMISTTQIHLREAPDLSSRILAIVRQGEWLEQLGSDGEYARVRDASGLSGFLKQKYLAAPSGEQLAEVVLDPILPDSLLDPAAAPVAARPAPAAPTPHTAAIASRRSAGDSASLPFYFSVQAGIGRSATDSARLQRALKTSAASAQVQDLDDTATVYGVSAGWRLRPWLAVELGLSSWGEYAARFSVREHESEQLMPGLARAHPVAGEAIDLSLVLGRSWGPWRLDGQLGMLQLLDGDIEARINDRTVHVAGEDNSVLLGVGAAYALNPSWQLGLRLRQVDLNDRLTSTTAVLSYSL